MGVSHSFAVVCAALAGFGFFRAFFDTGTYAVLILFGFGIGAPAPWILGMISDAVGLSAGLASRGAVWAVSSIALLLARTSFFSKDAAKIIK